MKHIYLREIDPNANDSLAFIVRNIPPNSKVLDVGTGSGALGRFLSARACSVDGITYSEEEAALARSAYSRLEIINLEQTLPSDCFGERVYDFVVCADILEHLRNPLAILQDLRCLLKPDGQLLLSIPNATYMGVIFELMGGAFERTREGILDATHVNFYDRKGLQALVESAGYRISAVSDVRKGMAQSEFIHLDPTAIPPAIREFVQQLTDADVYQFVWTLAPAECLPVADTASAKPFPEVVHRPQFCAQLFLDSGSGFNENDCAYAWGEFIESPQTLHFNFSEHTTLTQVRLDLADRPGVFEFFSLSLFDAAGDFLGSWQGDWSPELCLNQCEILPTTGLHGGRLMRATGPDPWVSIPASPAWASSVRAELKMTPPLPYQDFAFQWATRQFQGTIDRLNTALTTTQAQLTEKESILNVALDEQAQLKTRVDALSKMLAVITASTSWRITAGLRWLGNRLKKK